MFYMLRIIGSLLLVKGITGERAEFSCSGGGETGLFPDPEDCRFFYQCSAGTAYRVQCPSGLLYKAESLYCDWPDNVICEDDKPSTTTTTIRTTSTKATTEAEETASTKRSTTTVTTKSTTKTSTTTTTKTTSTTTTTKVPATTTTPSATTTTSSSTFSCGTQTREPITEEIRALRLKTCMISDEEVETVVPGSMTNPSNVRILESILPISKFRSIFPNANPAYTYANLLKAFAKFPTLCSTEQICRRTLATMFAHFQQETAGLIYLNEINKDVYCAAWTDWVVAAYPCTAGKRYFGRGAKQLSWNFNYGAFSNAMFGDAQILLDNPELVSATWLNFASALWFFITPQPPKPSMLAVLDKSWQPNQHDESGNRTPGFGTTTMIINGDIECGPSPINANASPNRQFFYRVYADTFHVDISGEKLDCADMKKFDATGSFQAALYWAPERGCSLVTWQTAFSALVEGNYNNCRQLANSSNP